MLRDWDDHLEQLKASQGALKHLQEEETHADETHGGAVLATIYALQNKRDDLHQEVRELKKHWSTWRKQLKEAAKEARQEKVRADAAEEELQRVHDTLQQAKQERDEARAAQPQAPAGPTQTLLDQGTQQLRQDLAPAKQELEQLRSRTSALTPTVDVAKMQSQLQEAKTTLAAQRGAVPDSVLQAWINALEQEGQRAQGRILELLDEGQTLQNQYQELHNQMDTMEVQLNGHLKLAEIERDGLKKRVALESEFSEKRGGEITRLSGEISRLNSEKDKLMEELQGIKNAPPPAAATQASYSAVVGSGVKAGALYGSPISSQVQKLGHFSPNVSPYGMAAAQAGSAGTSGQAHSYGSPQHLPPPPAHQYQGSLQPHQVSMNLFRAPVGLQPESPLVQGSTAGDNVGPFHLQ